MSTLPNEKGVMFTASSAKTIATVARKVSQQQGQREARSPSGPGEQQEWYARIVAEDPVRPGNYAWVKQTIENGKCVDVTDYYNVTYIAPDTNYRGYASASEVNGTTGIAVGTIVRMTWAGYSGTVVGTGSGSGSGSGSGGSGYIPPTPSPRFVFVYGGTSQSVVHLLHDGGYDGQATTGTEASWTYTITDVNSGINLAYRVPLYTHRRLAQKTIPATTGMVFKVTNPANVGIGGSAGINALAAFGSGSGSGTGSGSGSGGGPPPNLLRIVWADEFFPMCQYAGPLGSGSGSGSG